MTARRLRFKNELGIDLAGILDLPDGGVAHVAVMAHCFTCHKNYKLNRSIGQALNAHGMALLRLDFTGLGESGGRFSESNFTTGVADLCAASAAIIAAGLPAPGLLLGHSLGGTMAMVAATKLPDCRAVVAINSPFEPGQLCRHFGAQMQTIMRVGEAEIQIGGIDYIITRAFIEDLQRYDMQTLIAGLDRALLVMHAPEDSLVPIENAGHIFSAARHPKSFIALDRANHLLSGDDDAAYVGRLIATWAGRYLRR